MELFTRLATTPAKKIRRFFLFLRSFFDTKRPCSFRIADAMRIQIYIIALLLSAIMWSISFDAARESYHAAQSAGLMPNLHINKKLDRVL
ncbi:hypothetical protein ATY75_25835 [Rhizobium sp. N122]|uniref:hypothetical protein n=1 Tax=Rhizobium sp. N122 TaxID=1764272 RepID=UPI000B5A9B46|nr:hypothetical protein [Rhizobium sp. N122]OWV84718.1 hypothetical protein ATY75_25835 [Rhizobium sp. N122]